MNYEQLFFKLLEMVYQLRNMQTQYSYAEPGHEKSYLLNEIRAQTARIDIFMRDIQQVKQPSEVSK